MFEATRKRGHYGARGHGARRGWQWSPAAATTTTMAAVAATARRRRRQDRAAAPGVQDRSLRVAGPPALREEGQGALQRLRDHLQQRRPGRREAAAAGRGGAHPGRQGARARPGRRGLGAARSSARQAVRRPGHQLRPPDHATPTSTTTSRSTTRQVGKLQADDARRRSSRRTARNRATIMMINGAPTDNNAKLFKQGATTRVRRPGREDRQGVRHAGLEPRQGPAGDGAGDHRLGKDGFNGAYAANDGTAGGRSRR